ncbi:aminoacyl-tRNA hydrolase [Pelagibacterium xiamenense]|uniref:aminoacyl-tRNA hydrolase n=1 Tax=Pelagibacterium xiamenense TaxID=2901140 RepID=UPI001E4C7C4F|nr:aminoacyl-tRNA hydrolase [Pelagibacterium xiamenense]MCD7060304.1 aminoacyl-tRNA hydrolase [Pelagibacterium xiamenense]
MHLIVGLGNPGAEYAGHRHNIGFMAVDEIARQHNFPPFRQKFSALVSEAVIDGEKVMLLKPQTYMNLSGDSVGQAAKFFKLTPADISVIYDELDLAPGKVRIKAGGGNGGHNGVRSIDAHIGNPFVRVRLGIGHPGHKDRVQAHVLSNFHKVDAEWLEPLLDTLAKNAGMLAKGDASGLMNKLAIALNGSNGPGPDKAEKPKARSHIRQARPKPAAKAPETGPMAGMLKKLFGDKS